MLVLTGIFDNETFIPDSPAAIPQNKRVKVTIEEEPAAAKNHAQIWREFSAAIHAASDEVLTGEPVPVRFRTPEEIDAL